MLIPMEPVASTNERPSFAHQKIGDYTERRAPWRSWRVGRDAYYVRATLRSSLLFKNNVRPQVSYNT